MEIQHSRLERFAAWLRRHKLPLIIIGSVILALGIAAIIIFVFIPMNNQPEPEAPTEEEEQPPPPPIYYSKLSGLPIADPAMNQNPITCIMIENSPSARPHSGLKDSPIIYEAIAEGGITRFLSVWQNFDTTQLIGPVRSLRLYFLEWAAPYDCSIAHVGGSAEALAIIRNVNNGYRDIDQFFNDNSYWRATDRYAPHNVYTSGALLNALNEKRGYATSDFTAFPRATSGAPAEIPSATTVNFRISSANFNVTYTYSQPTNSYLRAYGTGNPHMTTTTCADLAKPKVKDCEQAQLSPSVLIAMVVQEFDSPAEPGREAIKTTGSGTAFVFQNGEVVKASWEKLATRQQIEFRDESGKLIDFIPGQIWITAIPNDPARVSWQ